MPDRSGRCPKLKWRFLSRGTSELENSFAFIHLRLLGRLSRAHSVSSDRGRICTWLLCRVRRPRHVSPTLGHVKSCVCVSGGRRPSLSMITSTITAAAAAAAAAAAGCCFCCCCSCWLLLLLLQQLLLLLLLLAAVSSSLVSDLVPDLRHCTFSASCSTLM